MKILLFAICIVIVGFIVLLPWIIRARVRQLSDLHIRSFIPPTRTKLNRYISILTWSNKWITAKAHEDLIRIRKLNDMLNKIQNPPG
ncbi:hypothetical protein ES705_47011 [subsurface metagenome]